MQTGNIGRFRFVCSELTRPPCGDERTYSIRSV